MKKFKQMVRGRKGGNQENSSQEQERKLCLQHLRKLFLEFLHPLEPMTRDQQERRLHLMLPLFLRVFLESEPSEMSERFGDVLQFAGHTSRLLVNEVQRRAANKPKVEAGREIILFLMRKPPEQGNYGWNLISTLNVLARGEISIIECMVAAQLPSNLVKMIKLFFYLPDKIISEEQTSEIKKKVMPTLTELCHHTITAKELIRTDDLAELFDALTCSSQPQHDIWRTGVSEILTAITRNCLTREVIEYIYDKSCIALSIANIQAMRDKDPLAVVEMFVTLILVLKDSAEVSSELLDSFKQSKGYYFLSDILVDFYKRDDPAAKEASRNLVLLVASLVVTGHKVLRPSMSIESPFQSPDYVIPSPTTAGPGLTVRNLDAFNVLLNTFLQTTDESLCLHILHAVQSIFNSDGANYFILSSLHPLTQFIERASEKSKEVQSHVFKLVEFVALQLRWVPTQELMAIGILFKHSSLKSCQAVALHTLIRLINQDDNYKDVFREVGLLEVITNALKVYSNNLKDSVNASAENLTELEGKEDEALTEYIFLLMECLRLLVENNVKNAALFRQCGGSRCAHNLIPFKSARPYALRIVQQLIVDGGHDDLGTLLGLMHSTPKTDVKLKADVLSSMLRIFAMNGQTRTVFQEVGGFVYVVSVLVSLEGSLDETPMDIWEGVDRGAILELIWAIFQVLTAAMQDEPVNKVIFMDEARFRGLTDTLKLLRCFPALRQEFPPLSNEQYSPMSCLVNLNVPRVRKDSRDFMQMVLFRCLTSMACGSFENWDLNSVEDPMPVRSSVSSKIPRIIHPGALLAVIELLPSLWVVWSEDNEVDKTKEKELPKVLVYVISQLQHILGSDQNQQLLCEAGLPYLLLKKCKQVYMNENHPINAALTKLFERLASQSVAPKVLRIFLRLGSPLCSRSTYAMLRARQRAPVDSGDETDSSDVNLTLSESTFHEEKRKRAMSLRIYDGDLRISCGIGSERDERETSMLVEDDEFFSEDLGIDPLVSDSTDTPPLKPRVKYADSISVSSAVDVTESEEIGNISDSSDEEKPPIGNEADVHHKGDYSNRFRFENDSPHPHANEKPILSTASSIDDDFNSYPDGNLGKADDQERDILTVDSMSRSKEAREDAKDTTVTVDPYGEMKEATNDNRGAAADSVRGSKGTITDSGVSSTNSDTENKSGLSVNDESLIGNEAETKQVVCPEELLGTDDTTELSKNNSESITLNRSKTSETNRTVKDEERTPERERSVSYLEHEINRICDRLEGNPPPQNIIKCLVSLTTPRDVLSVSTQEPPAFVEFDMSHDGFAYLFLPSLTPLAATAINFGNKYLAYSPSGIGSVNPTGVLNSGDRSFPPPIGLTFSIWLFIERLPPSSSAPHFRILTLQRRFDLSNAKRRGVTSLFSVVLDLEHKQIVVSTEEGEQTKTGTFRSGHTELRAPCESLFEEASWNHLCIVLNRSVVRTSTASIYVNGDCVVSTSKIRYIQPGIPSGVDVSSTKVSAIIGTDSSHCHISELIWRMGPTCLLEEPLLDDAVNTIYKLGPNYSGCFQAPVVNEYFEEDANEDVHNALLQEDKINFCLSSRNFTTLSLQKIKTLSHSEAKAVTEEVNLPEDDRYTPVSFIHNSAMHFQGLPRTAGAVLIGSAGIRSFCPNHVASAFMSVGGMSILLSLVAMAANLEELYSALKALTCIVQSSKIARKEMVRVKGYQVLAYLLKRKCHLLNTHILHLIFSLVGTVRSDQESASIPNVIAFRDLLCDMEIWHRAPAELERSLYSHYFELITQGSECATNAVYLRRYAVLPRLLLVLQDGKPSDTTLNTIANVMSVLLCKSQQKADLQRFGQFVASTLPSKSSSEKEVHLEDSVHFNQMFDAFGNQLETTSDIINMRNVLLDVILDLLHGSAEGGIDHSFSELLVEVLGYDWILLFLYSHVHKSTVIRAARILVTVLSNSVCLNHFENGDSNGGWLEATNIITRRKVPVAAGFNVPESEENESQEYHGYEVNTESCNFKGFRLLTSLLEDHTDLTEIHFLLFALLLGYPVTEVLIKLMDNSHTVKAELILEDKDYRMPIIRSEIPPGLALTLDTLYLMFWPAPNLDGTGSPANRNVNIYWPDVVLVLLSIVRKLIDESSSVPTEADTKTTPSAIIQFMEFLYSNKREFAVYCTSKKFIHFLAATVFPKESKIDTTEDDDLYSENFEETEVGLSTHPCGLLVINFIKHILLDSMTSLTGKSGNMLDIALEGFPLTATPGQQKEYQTTLMRAVVNGVLDGDFLKGSASSQSNFSKFALSIGNFSSKLVDKLWIGVFTKDYEVIFGFLLRLIAKFEEAQGNVDPIYRALNRAVLYQLSRPQVRITDQTALLEFLHLLTSNSKTVFAPANRDTEFIACMTHWLLVIALQGSPGNGNGETEDGPEEMEEKEPLIEGSETSLHREESSEVSCGKLISAAAGRVWDVFYQLKKEEDIFRMQATPTFTTYEKEHLAVGPGRPMTLDMRSAKSMLGDHATKVWMGFVTSEEKKKADAWSVTPQQQQQAPSKLNTVARISRKFKKDKEQDGKFTVKIGNVWTISEAALCSREQIAKFATMKAWDTCNTWSSSSFCMGSLEEMLVSESLSWNLRHLAVVKALTSYFYERYQQDNLIKVQSAEKNWRMMETELIRERGIWGPEKANPLDKWTLGMTEGPHRMRKRICKNDSFYMHYPYKKEETPEQMITKYRAAYSHDSKLLYQVCQKYVTIETQPEDDEKPAMFTWTPSVYALDGSESDSFSLQVNSQSIVQLLETGEKIYSMYRCARVRGLDSAEGLFLFGRDHFYVVDGFTLLSTEVKARKTQNSREIKDIDSLPPGTHEPLIPVAKGNVTMERSFSKWAFEDIKEVHQRRYLLQNIAMEVFSHDGSNHLLVFPKKAARDKVYVRLKRMAPVSITKDKDPIAGMTADGDVESGHGLLSGLMGERSVCNKWEVFIFCLGRAFQRYTNNDNPTVVSDVKGEISNFQYLMYLNTLAGRSYNDLMQYPIFPWILADYESEELDLMNPKTFRDLSKPMGAQGEERLAQYRRRYRDWEDPTGETPAYYYGTHYSSAMIVASYLIRMEPLTQYFLRLQGGHFDLPDRLFHSIKDAWLSASENNMADIKELIPEFFYLPEFLLNSNKFDLGRKQNGEMLGDVNLPPWAKGDPREFIRVHRKALECDYVSAHLHEWIDLVFGYKQQGPASEEADNVFHHLFYEGAVDLDKIQDPLKRKATIGFINNFGQMPKQLFRKPHPCKRALKVQDPTPQTGTLLATVSVTNDRLFFHNLQNLVPSVQPVKELRGPVGQIVVTDRNLFAVEVNKVLFAPFYNRYIFYGFRDFSFRYCAYDDKVLNVFEDVFPGKTLCAASLDHGGFVTGSTSSQCFTVNRENSGSTLTLYPGITGHSFPIKPSSARLFGKRFVYGKWKKSKKEAID